MVEPKQALHKFHAGVFTRLKDPPSDMMVKYQYVPCWPEQKPLYPAEVASNMAWVVMLAEQGIAPRADAGKILSVLRDMEQAGADAFPFDPKNGDTYFNIESYVIERVGAAAGGWMYAGRSRNDGNPTTMRLFLNRQLVDLGEVIVRMCKICLDKAEQHLETVMPGYTGSQPGQPWTFGYYLLSFVDSFARDFDRLAEVYPRVNLGLLGSGCGSGSELPLDQQRAAELLGFDGFIENSREFVSSADAFVETVSACSIVLMHLGQMAHDLHTWCTQEFGMMEPSDKFCASSSYMPQKKNPTALHKIRSISAASVGLVPSLLAVIKHSSQDFDHVGVTIQPTITAVKWAHDASDYMGASIADLQIHADVMRQRALDYWTTASEVSSLIVRERGLAWRTAHRIAERFLRTALEEKRSPTGVTGEMLDVAAVEIIGQPITLETELLRRSLDPMEFLHSRRTVGSPKPAECARMLADRRVAWAKRREWCTERKARLSAARTRLDEAMDALIQESVK